MENLKTYLKFTLSKETGKYICFVSVVPNSGKILGVEEKSGYRKKICVADEKLNKLIEEDVTYECELKPMHNGKGFVAVSVKKALFKASFKLIINPPKVFLVCIQFGAKIVYYEPNGKGSSSSTTVDGVIKLLQSRVDLRNPIEVIEKFKNKANELHKQMESHGIPIREHKNDE